MEAFKTSLKNDVEAVACVNEQLDFCEAETFIDLLDCCEGQLITSGIGNYHTIGAVCGMNKL